MPRQAVCDAASVNVMRRPFRFTISTVALAAVLAVPVGQAAATTPRPIRVNTTVGQADGGRTDIVRVRLSGTGAEGAVATLYRRVDERNVRVASAALDAAGRRSSAPAT